MTESCLNPQCRLPLLSEREIAQGMHIPDCLPPIKSTLRKGRFERVCELIAFRPMHLKKFLARSQTSVLLTGGESA